ncbi:hypothetical protein J3F84DRAFT_369716 [Trichoderma pleuroticola]
MSEFSCDLLTQLGIFSFVFSLYRCSQIPWICMAGVREKYDREQKSIASWRTWWTKSLYFFRYY